MCSFFAQGVKVCDNKKKESEKKMNYPNGTGASDQDAPWNEKPPKLCDECEGEGFYFDDDYDKIKCENCGGEGVLNGD